MGASSEARLRIFDEHSELNRVQTAMNLTPTDLAPLPESDAVSKLTECITILEGLRARMRRVHRRT
jgi:hypothetical protein